MFQLKYCFVDITYHLWRLPTGVLLHLSQAWVKEFCITDGTSSPESRSVWEKAGASELQEAEHVKAGSRAGVNWPGPHFGTERSNMQALPAHMTLLQGEEHV